MPKNVNITKTRHSFDGNGVQHVVGTKSLQIIGSGSPDFLHKVRLGQFLSPLPYTRTSIEEIYPIYSEAVWRNDDTSVARRGRPGPTQAKLIPKRYFTEKSQAFGGAERVAQTVESEAVSIAKAVQRFYDDAKSLDSSVGVMIGEMPQTFRLIGDTAARLAGCFSKLKKGRISDAFKELSYTNPRLDKRLRKKYTSSVVRQGQSGTYFASNAWLELQYGWKPLLSDVHNACSDLASRFSVQPADISIRGSHEVKGKITWQWYSGNGNQPQPPWPKLYGLSDNGGRLDRRVGFVCYARVLDSKLRAQANLGMINPLSIAWELMPWSFVVDWFVPIGPYIDSLRSTAGLTFIAGSRSVLTRQDHGYMCGGVTGVSKSSNQFRELLSGVSEYSYKETRMVRTTISNFPNPSQMLRIKSLDEALSLSHAANGIALMRQVFS